VSAVFAFRDIPPENLKLFFSQESLAFGTSVYWIFLLHLPFPAFCHLIFTSVNSKFDVQIGGNDMKNKDLYEEALEKKFIRLEKWIHRLQKEMWFLKETYNRTGQLPPKRPKAKIEQLTFFGT